MRCAKGAVKSLVELQIAPHSNMCLELHANLVSTKFMYFKGLLEVCTIQDSYSLKKKKTKEISYSNAHLPIRFLVEDIL